VTPGRRTDRPGAKPERAPASVPEGRPALEEKASSAPSSWLARHGPLVAVLLVIAAAATIRLRVANVPLERDEGEYAYAGQLILRGVPPYELAYNMKFPGTYYAYALALAVFGESARGVRAGLLVVNAATILLVFSLGRRLLGGPAGAIAAASFALLSLDRWVMGVFAHATHFVILPALASLALLLPARAPAGAGRVAAAGALAGLAVLMKQQGGAFLLLAAALVWWNTRSAAESSGRKILVRIAWLLFGALLPVLAVLLVLAAQGVLDRFFFWTFRYALAYVSEVTLADAWPAFLSQSTFVARASWPLWLLAGLGFAALWLGRWRTDVRAFVTGLVLASLVALSPGFHFREHYFILLLPAAALCTGIAAETLHSSLARRIRGGLARALAACLVAAAAAAYVAAEREYLFTLPPRDVSRSVFGANPFVEAESVARYVRDRTSPEDPIAVFGSEPEIYFLADRRSATGYIYTYALMEPQPFAARMQDEMRREIERARPKYVVGVRIATSWLVRKESGLGIIEWFERFKEENYDLVGVVDIHSPASTTFAWDGDAKGYAPRSTNLIEVYRLKGAGTGSGGRGDGGG